MTRDRPHRLRPAILIAPHPAAICVGADAKLCTRGLQAGSFGAGLIDQLYGILAI